MSLLGPTMVAAGGNIYILGSLEALKKHFSSSWKGKTGALDNQYMNLFLE